MEKERKRISCDQARELDIVNYLDSVGITPARIKGDDYWYHSPFREERIPSFKVNIKLNRFFDFGEGWGGNLIDFGTRFHNCCVSDVLKIINTHSLLQRPIAPTSQGPDEIFSKINIQATQTISAPSLLRYLDSRRIPAQLAMQYCQEVHYRIGRKNYYAIGFKNDLGGYEIRNPYFKGSTTPKTVTTFQNGFKTVSVFEGFFDFLSFLILFEHKPQFNSDFLILNSLSFFEKSSHLMEAYDYVGLYLDNNTAGQNCVTKALAKNKCYQDRSAVYKNHEDLNDWLAGRFTSPDKTDPSHHDPP